MTRERNRRIVVAAGAGIFQRFVQAATTIVIMPLMLRTLGTAKFGVWSAVTSLAWLYSLVDLGVSQALITLVARADTLNRLDDQRKLVVGALALGSGLAILFSTVAFLIVHVTVHSPQATLFLIAIVAMALNIPLNTASHVWMGFQKGHVSGFWDLAQTLLTAGGLIVATRYSADVRLYVAIVYLGLVLSNLGSLIHLFLAHSQLRTGTLSGIGSAIRRVARQGISYFLLTVAAAITYLFDNVLALEILGPEASARMAIAMRICMTSWGMLAVLSMPLWPAFTEAGIKADRKWIRKSILRSAALLTSVATTGAVLLIVFGRSLLRLWLGTDLGIDTGLLVAIAAWILMEALYRVPNLFLNALSIIRFQFFVGSTATIVAFILKFILARHIGVGGILWATTISLLLIVVPADVWRIVKWMKSPHPQAIVNPEQSELDITLARIPSGGPV